MRRLCIFVLVIIPLCVGFGTYCRYYSNVGNNFRRLPHVSGDQRETVHPKKGSSRRPTWERTTLRHEQSTPKGHLVFSRRSNKCNDRGAANLETNSKLLSLLDKLLEDIQWTKHNSNGSTQWAKLLCTYVRRIFYYALIPLLILCNNCLVLVGKCRGYFFPQEKFECLEIESTVAKKSFWLLTQEEIELEISKLMSRSGPVKENEHKKQPPDWLMSDKFYPRMETAQVYYFTGTELERLASFRAIQGKVAISTLQLAEHGFFFNGEQLECSGCHFTLKPEDIRSDPRDPRYHSYRSCSFVNVRANFVEEGGDVKNEESKLGVAEGSDIGNRDIRDDAMRPKSSEKGNQKASRTEQAKSVAVRQRAVASEQFVNGSGQILGSEGQVEQTTRQTTCEAKQAESGTGQTARILKQRASANAQTSSTSGATSANAQTSSTRVAASANAQTSSPKVAASANAQASLPKVAASANAQASSPRVAASANSQTSSTRGAPSGNAQTSSTRGMVSANAQASSTRGAASTNAQASSTRGAASTNAQASSTNAMVSANAQASSTRGAASTNAQASSTRGAASTNAQASSTRGAASTNAQTSSTRGAASTNAQASSTNAMVSANASATSTNGTGTSRQITARPSTASTGSTSVTSNTTNRRRNDSTLSTSSSSTTTSSSSSSTTASSNQRQRQTSVLNQTTRERVESSSSSSTTSSSETTSSVSSGSTSETEPLSGYVLHNGAAATTNERSTHGTNLAVATLKGIGRSAAKLKAIARRNRERLPSTDSGYSGGSSESVKVMDDIDTSKYFSTEAHCVQSCQDVHDILSLKCNRHKDHYSYFPLSRLVMNHLPSPLRSEETLTFVQLLGKLTVRIVVRHTSQTRPENDPALQAQKKRIGTGMVCLYDLDRTEEESNASGGATKKLSALKHLISRGKKDQEIYIQTSKYVIFDDKEAASATVEFFFDRVDKRKDIVKVKGLRVVHKNEFLGDKHSILVCKADQSLIKQIQKIKADFFQQEAKLPDKIKSEWTKKAVIVSHPLGSSSSLSHGDAVTLKYKKVKQEATKSFSLKKLNQVPEDVTQLYKAKLYSADTCPGSCGAAVITYVMVGKDNNGSEIYQMEMWTHQGIEKEARLSVSAIQDCTKEEIKLFKNPPEQKKDEEEEEQEEETPNTLAYPLYALHHERLRSFQDWTQNHLHEPEILAFAGFFYAGYADCVRCFHCGLGLRSWKSGDSLYGQHLIHRPNCYFLSLHFELFDKDDLLSLEHPVMMKIMEEAKNAPFRIGGGSSSSESSIEEDGDVGDVDSCDEIENSGLKKAVLQLENTGLRDQMLCKVCRYHKMEQLLLPCGHFCICSKCCDIMSHCPFCNKKITAKVTTYFG